MNVKFVIDSACDIPAEKAKELNVTVLPMKINFGDEEYLDDVTMSHDEFYRRLIQTDVMPKTSQVSPFDYENAFKKLTADGSEVVCLTLGSGFSGSYQSALIAAENFAGKVFVVDTQTVSVAEMLLLWRGIDYAKKGKKGAEIAQILTKEKDEVRIIALLDTLEYLKKGGRISAAEAAIGGVLKVKPVITARDNRIVMLGKARGSRAGNNKMTEMINEAGGIDFDRPLALAYSGLSRLLLDIYIQDQAFVYSDHMKAEDIPVCSMGCTVGTHAGPGAIAAAFFVQ